MSLMNMDWLTEWRLKRLAGRANPDPGFTRALQKTLRTMDAGHKLFWINWRKLTSVSILTVLVAGSATSVYAYSSNDVLPDSPLYPVREAIENVESATATTPEAKADMQVKLLQRHLEEARLMQLKNKKLPSPQLQKINDELQAAIKESTGLPSARTQALTQTIQKIKDTHLDMLINLRKQTTDEKSQIELDRLIKTQAVPAR